MTVGEPGWQVQVEPALLEEAVLQAAAVQTADEARAFRDERDGLYGIEDGDQRESAFRELSGRWSSRWRLTAPLLEALAALPQRPSARPRCLLLAARSDREEGADLHAGMDGPAVVVRARAVTLADPGRLVALLSREMLHVADLLDPSFGFDPDLAEPLVRHPAARERYRLLWRATVDGRLGLDEIALRRRREEFAAAFAGDVEQPAELFERLMRGPRPTHGELLRLAAGRAPQAQASP